MIKGSIIRVQHYRSTWLIIFILLEWKYIYLYLCICLTCLKDEKQSSKKCITMTLPPLPLPEIDDIDEMDISAENANSMLSPLP